MKIFTNKNVIQKIIITILIVLSFNFVAPTFSQAFGGLLLDPILSLFIGIGDTILSILQNYLYDGGGHDGILNSLLGAIYFKTAQDLGWYPEMEFHDDNMKAIEIKTEDFELIDIEDVLLTVLSGPAGIINAIGETLTGSTYQVPVRQYTIDKIFSGKIPAFDINFINPDTSNYKGIGEHNGQNAQDKIISVHIRETIASWYIALRNLAIVGLLSVLLYVGIRMIISSTASDKAKYKQMLMDWLISLCILFFLH